MSQPTGELCKLKLLNADVAHSPGIGHAPEAVQEQADLTKTQQGWDRYVAAQLRGAKGSACQAKLVSALEAELAQPGTPPAPLPLATLAGWASQVLDSFALFCILQSHC